MVLRSNVVSAFVSTGRCLLVILGVGHIGEAEIAQVLRRFAVSRVAGLSCQGCGKSVGERQHKLSAMCCREYDASSKSLKSVSRFAGRC